MYVYRFFLRGKMNLYLHLRNRKDGVWNNVYVLHRTENVENIKVYKVILLFTFNVQCGMFQTPLLYCCTSDFRVANASFACSRFS